MEFATRAIHAGQEPDPLTGAVVTPIHLATTFQQDAPGKHKGFEYTRTLNPTRKSLEECITQLEEGSATACFASGVSAISAIIQTLSPGDGIVAGHDLYGGTVRLLDKIYSQWGIEVVYAEDNHPSSFEQAIQKLKNPRLVWIESPTNPLLNIVDINSIANIAHKEGLKLAVDNTFATPYLQKPLLLGADYVVHSSTKYLGGHSDVLGGAVTVKNLEDIKPIQFIQNSIGAVPSPFDCYLLMRGIKTLHVRMERHCDNAEKIVQYLIHHPKIKKVYYPGLEKPPILDIAQKQMLRFGGMITIELKDMKTLENFYQRVKIFTLAESLGAVESLFCVPYYMTHAGLSEEKKQKLGVIPTLVRLSIGIEDINDLLSDLKNALD
ncbi:MAG TPA: PLP-dependent aspartate aminotransferase family protein [Candidatus Hydrogenedens sp.]|nr:PLP-dependent aspartate aminotransferase family protein [Candidatus Hydrogenedens sp.]HPP59065.1 PLP-dependent aspartate aminotransferase family protein [Candidatus Hydrogenedens sp.]